MILHYNEAFSFEYLYLPLIGGGRDNLFRIVRRRWCLTVKTIIFFPGLFTAHSRKTPLRISYPHKRVRPLQIVVSTIPVSVHRTWARVDRPRLWPKDASRTWYNSSRVSGNRDREGGSCRYDRDRNGRWTIEFNFVFNPYETLLAAETTNTINGFPAEWSVWDFFF